jgi:hypothetical protein
MLRLIYNHPAKGYQTFDAELNSVVTEKEKSLKTSGCETLCIVDYKLRSISQKGPNYSTHRDFIDDIIFDPKYAKNYYH